MKHAILLVIVATGIIGSLFCIYLARGTETAGLWTAERVVDLGSVLQGQKLNATFSLVNHHSEIVNVAEVVTACTCSQAVVSTMHVLPGQPVQITVSWQTGRSRGSTGTNLQVIYMLADGTKRTMALRVQGNVVPDVVFSPRRLVFQGGHAHTSVLTLSSGHDTPFRVLKVYSNNSAFTAQLNSSDSILVSFVPDKWQPDERVEPLLIVDTDCIAEPQLFIPLNVTKAPSR
jgi:hypothetical protein